MKKIEANLTNKADWKTPFREVRGLAFSPKDAWRENDLVCIEDDFEYQTIRGFGAAVTEAATETWAKLPAEERRKVVHACFNRGGLGYNSVRIHMNSCDFSLGNWSCDDTKGDFALRDFSVERYRRSILPFLRAARAEAGAPLWTLASPWSPPAWMKTNGKMNEGGRLKPSCRDAWALFYVKFAEALAAEGVPVSAFTVQNEEKAKQTWDSCVFTAEQTRDFVRDHLGPALAKAGLSRKVALYFWDHNKERTLERARVLLGDAKAARMVAGVAVHWYSGDHFEQLRMFKERWPKKDILFSECCCGIRERTENDAWRRGELYAHDIIGNLNAGMSRWIDWNVLLDAQGGPNHVGNFCAAPLLANAAGDDVAFLPTYFYIGHLSKYIQPGAVRIGWSKSTDAIDVTAVRNPDGRHAAVLLNRTDRDLRPCLRFRGQLAPVDLPAHGILSCAW